MIAEIGSGSVWVSDLLLMLPAEYLTMSCESVDLDASVIQSGHSRVTYIDRAQASISRVR